MNFERKIKCLMTKHQEEKEATDSDKVKINLIDSFRLSNDLNNYLNEDSHLNQSENKSNEKSFLSSYERLTIIEKRIIFLFFEKNMKKNKLKSSFSFTKKDYFNSFFYNNFDFNKKKEFEKLFYSIDRFFQRYWTDSESKVLNIILGNKIHWLQDIFYDNENEKFYIKFSDKALLMLNNFLSKEELRMEVLSFQNKNLKSKYSQKILNIILKNNKGFLSKNYKDNGFILNMNIEELKNKLSIPKCYSVGMIKKQILIPSLKELRKELSIYSQIKFIKKGRKISNIEFTFLVEKQV